MTFWERFADWAGAGETWTGAGGLLDRTGEHLWVSVFATVVAVALALPAAVWLAHHRRARFSANAIANLGRAVPSFGIIVVAAVVFLQYGGSAQFWPLALALVALAIPPVFTNAYTAIAEVDAATVEAARGMGYSEAGVLRQIELPLGTPLILEGVRVAFVQVLATATLGAIVAPYGLGVPIVKGFATARSGGDVLLVGGSIVVALVTLLGDRTFAWLEQRLVPPGVRRLLADVEPTQIGQG